MDLALPVLRKARNISLGTDKEEMDEDNESNRIILSIDDAEHFASKTLPRCISVLIRCDKTEKPDDIGKSLCDIVRFISSCIQIGYDELNTSLPQIISQPAQNSAYQTKQQFYDIYGCIEKKSRKSELSRKDATYKYARPLRDLEEQRSSPALNIKQNNQKSGDNDGNSSNVVNLEKDDASNQDDIMVFSCSRYVLDCIEAFGLSGGFEAIIRRIENQNDKPSLAAVKVFVHIFYSCSEFLSDETLSVYCKRIEKAFSTYLLGLTNDELRFSDRILVKSIIQDLVSLCKEPISDSPRDISSLISRIDSLRKLYALKNLRCPHMQPRLAGLQDLRDLIKFAKENQEKMDDKLRRAKKAEIN